jgi:AraC-like DNA-binding protein
MEDRALYKEPTLTVSDLAGALSVTPHNLSQVINTQFGKNFYDFVNTYRVEEAKRRLVNPKDTHLTILAIAEESGFNSKSSFNTFFRKHAGMTPSEYRKRQTPNTKYQT